jgi:hypothetical protein
MNSAKHKLQAWHKRYMSVSWSWYYETPQYDCLGNEVDQARIEQEVQAITKNSATNVGLCRKCDRILKDVQSNCEIRELRSKPAVDTILNIRPWSRYFDFHNSTGLDAASRLGCRLCYIIMHAMVQHGALQKLRSVEQSLWTLGLHDLIETSDHPMEVTVGLAADTQAYDIIQIFFRRQGRKSEYSRSLAEDLYDDPLLSLDVRGKSKSSKLFSGVILESRCLMKCRSNSGG